MIKLNDRDERMAQEYMIDHSAMAAAIRAGYAYSTAKNASEWIHKDHPKKPKLRQRIDELTADQSRRTGITADRILAELARVAFANPADVIDFETGGVLPGAAKDDTAAIASVKIRGGKKAEREVRFHSKERALELLGDYLGLFSEKRRQEESASGSISRVEELMARLDAEASQPRPEGASDAE